MVVDRVMAKAIIFLRMENLNEVELSQDRIVETVKDA